MLRGFILFLVLANAGYFAWSQGLLRDWGWAPASQSEPQRVQQQMRPQALRVLSADELRRQEAGAAAAVAKPLDCLMAGPFTEAQANSIHDALHNNLPKDHWEIYTAVIPARWIVYMGKYPNADAVQRKRQELRQMGVPYEPLDNASLEPGVSLGGFGKPSDAEAALAALAKRGVRTARVVQEVAEQRGQIVKLPSVDDRVRGRLETIQGVFGERGLRPCKAP